METRGKGKDSLFTTHDPVPLTLHQTNAPRNGPIQARDHADSSRRAARAPATEALGQEAKGEIYNFGRKSQKLPNQLEDQKPKKPEWRNQTPKAEKPKIENRKSKNQKSNIKNRASENGKKISSVP